MCLLSACAAQRAPENLEAVGQNGGFQAQYRDPPAVVSLSEPVYLRSPALNAQSCRPALGDGSGGGAGKVSGVPQVLRGERLSRGDLLDVRVAEDELFPTSYTVSFDGNLRLPYINSVRAAGRSVEEIEAEIQDKLVASGFYVLAPTVSVRVADFAGVRVGVSGAVFEPQPVEIGGVPGDSVDIARQTAIGASTEGRSLYVALRAAGGIRPDADLSAVTIERAGRSYRVDLRPLMEGRNVGDIMLLSGDNITVPSRDCFQDNLMKPSPISPPGVSLYVSNLTEPATSNASSAIGREVREVPYGTRYMQAVIDTNCVGGARSTSADRAAALMSRNPVTDVSVVVQRRIEDLLRRPDRDDYDPYLLPEDAIACYDSSVTSISDLARVFAVIGGAAVLIGSVP